LNHALLLYASQSCEPNVFEKVQVEAFHLIEHGCTTAAAAGLEQSAGMLLFCVAWLRLGPAIWREL
jgi:hypothetical protein